MTSGIRKSIIGAAACIALAAGAYLLFADRRPQQPGMSPFAEIGKPRPQVPVLFTAPSWDFVDQNGRRSKDSELKGRIWIANFIFTNCAGACPKVTAQMIELQKNINDPEIRFVSFSVDPERDDPATLKDYARTNNTGEQRWLLLRPPDRQKISQLAQRMMAVAHSPDAHDTILHTDFFILIDHKGSARGLYDSKSPDAMAQLKADIATIARQRLIEITPNAGAAQ